MWLCVHSDESGKSFPTRKTLALEAGVNLKTLDKYIDAMKVKGLITVVSRNKPNSKEKTSNLYQVNILEYLETFVDGGEVTPKTVQPYTKNGITPYTKNGSGTVSIININPINSTTETSSVDVIKHNPLGADIVKEFEKVNPASKKFYNNNTQRSACDDLIKTYGIEKVLNVVEKTLPRTNKEPFFPRISTPLQLFEKWSTLESAIHQWKAKNNKTKVAILSDKVKF